MKIQRSIEPILMKDRKASQDAQKATGLIRVKRGRGKRISDREKSVQGGW